MDQKKLKYQMEMIDMHECLEQATQQCGPGGERKEEVRLKKVFEAEAVTVVGDRLHLTNAIFNLLIMVSNTTSSNRIVRVTTQNTNGGDTNHCDR
jgi:hypothetical protein